MKKFFILSVFLFGCNVIKTPETEPIYIDPSIPEVIATGSSCISSCGISAEGFPGTCRQFQQSELGLIQGFLTVNFSLTEIKKTKTETELCGGLNGLRIFYSVKNSLNGKADPDALYGQYFPAQHTIQFSYGSYLRVVVPHEVGHALDYVFTPELAIMGDGHENWYERGFPVSSSSWSYQVYVITSNR